MNFDALRKSIETTIQAGFVNGPNAFFPITFANTPFVQPKGATWGRVSIQLASTANSAIGHDFKRSLGMVFVQMFAGEDAGQKQQYQAADLLASILDDVTISDGSGGTVLFYS